MTLPFYTTRLGVISWCTYAPVCLVSHTSSDHPVTRTCASTCPAWCAASSSSTELRALKLGQHLHNRACIKYFVLQSWRVGRLALSILYWKLDGLEPPAVRVNEPHLLRVWACMQRVHGASTPMSSAVPRQRSYQRPMKSSTSQEATR
jgi:hypothetical protein